MKLARVALVLTALAVAPLAQQARRMPEPPPPAHVFDAAVVVLGPLDPALEHLIDLDADGEQEALGMRVEAWVRPSRINLSTLSPDGTPVPFWEGEFFTQSSLPRVETAVGDLNGDGLHDFAVLADETLWTWTSNGLAAPTVNGSVPVPVDPYDFVLDLVLGDFDGDGRMDPAVLDEQELHVWLSGPDGVPQEPMSIAFPHLITNLDGNYMLPGDFDPSAGQELVVTSMRELYFFDFQGGAPLAGPVLNAATAYIVSGMSWGDVDGDGDDDLVVWRDSGNVCGQHRVLEQTAPYTFAWREGWQAGGPATNLIDVDGDGDLDGACCGGSGGNEPPPRPNDATTRFQIALNDGSGSFACTFKVPGLGARQLAGVMDVNGDGLLDLVAGRAVYFAKGRLDDDPVPTYTATNLGSFTDDGHVDYDGDGDLDFALDPADGVLESDGSLNPTLVPVTVLDSPTGSVDYRYLGDWDGDGDPDWIARDYGSSSFHLVRNLGGGVFEWGPPAAAAGLNLPQWHVRHAWDADEDGDLDLIVTDNGSGDGMAQLFWNDGTGYFASGGPWIDQDVGGFADLDGDGREDVLVHVEGQEIGWLRNLGGGSFGAPYWFPQATAQYASSRTLGVGDMDADGDLDVWSARSRTAIVYLENQGQGVFTARLDVLPAPNPDYHRSGRQFDLRVLDVNVDGVLDVIRFPGHGAVDAGILYLAQAPGGPYVESDELVFGGRMPYDLDADGDPDLVGRSIHENRTRRPPFHATVRQYGSGTPGLAELVPKLGCRGPIQAGHVPPLLVTNGRGRALGILACSPLSGVYPDTPYPGVTSYLDLSAGTTPCRSFRLDGLPGEAGAGSIEVSLPATLDLVGRRLHFQAFLVDDGAPAGVSATNALRLVYGLSLD